MEMSQIQKLLWIVIVAVSVAVVAGLNEAWAADSASIDLSGTWRFRLDPKGVGLQENWFTTRLPQEIHLPGTTDEAKLGIPNTAKPSLDGLYRPNVYAGPAWYQRDIEIPDGWKGKRVQLFLERVHWETRVWLDGREIGGMEDSLVVPHLHDLGEVAPGKHVLTVCADNTLKFDLGRFASINYEGTQTNWNGLVGKLEVRVADPVSIEDLKVYPDVDHRLVRVGVTIRNGTRQPAAGVIGLSIEQIGGPVVVFPIALKEFRAAKGTTVVNMEYADEKLREWDEFSPRPYRLVANLDCKRGEQVVSCQTVDSRSVTFGLRKLQIRGTQFVLNGRPLFLRGTLECGIFPKTGYPAMDVAAWQRIFRIVKSYGLNFMRFHSWCPPEAAFAAADIEGVYLQVEGPEANIRIDRQKPIGQFMEKELLRIVRTYGNHPSFLLMTTGNEHRGVGDTFEHWVKMLRDEDPRHLYAASSYGQSAKNSQFIESTAGRGVHGPGTTYDLRTAIAGRDFPTIGHEIGQWTFFPNFDEISKYDGVLLAKNFELVRDDLAKKHLLDLEPKFVQATGRQAVLLYKEEIESLRRTPGFAGFSLLDLHDYPGQGTALVGPLDPFWDSKGFVTPE
jgi:hypothetical protein